MNWKRWLPGLVAAGCLIGLIRWAGPFELWAKLKGVAPGLVALGFGAALASYVLKAARYLLVLGRKAGLRRVLGIVIAQNVIAQLAPMRAGDISYVVLVRKTGIASVGHGLASLLLVRTADLVILWAMYVVSLGQLRLGLPAYRWAAVVMGVALTAGVGALGAVIFAVDRVAGPLERLLGRWGLLRSDPARRAWADLVGGARNLSLVVRPGRLAAITAVSAAIWALSVLWNYLVWLAVGLRLTAAQVVFMTSFSYLITLLPVFLFGGIGLGDVITTGVLSAFGKTGEAAAFSLCNRVLASVYQVLFALMFFAVMWGRWNAAGEDDGKGGAVPAGGGVNARLKG